MSKSKQGRSFSVVDLLHGVFKQFTTFIGYVPSPLFKKTP